MTLGVITRACQAVTSLRAEAAFLVPADAASAQRVSRVLLWGHTEGDDPLGDPPAEAFDKEDWWGDASLMTLGIAALTRQLAHLAVEHVRSEGGKLIGVRFWPTAAWKTHTVAYTVAAEVTYQVRPACVVPHAHAQAARQRFATAMQILARWLCVSALPTNAMGKSHDSAYTFLHLTCSTLLDWLLQLSIPPPMHSQPRLARTHTAWFHARDAWRHHSSLSGGDVDARRDDLPRAGR